MTVEAAKSAIGRACRSAPLLSVKDLTVNLVDGSREVSVLNRVGFEIAAGEVLGLLGESGSGKTTTALALLRVLPRTAKIAHGSVTFEGRDLLSLPEKQLQDIRGAQISLIHQDRGALNPVMRVRDQVAEVVRAHRSWNARQRREAAEEILVKVGLEGDRFYSAYPHQLSGGQCQRVLIAQALVCRPRLIIADEPTASLDTSSSLEILKIVKSLKELSDTSFLIIHHDPSLLGDVVDRVLVMYGGEIIEDGSFADVYREPLHPYTKALVNCAARGAVSGLRDRTRRLPCIPGNPPDFGQGSAGCRFLERCPDRMQLCEVRNPELVQVSTSQSARCFKYGE